MIGFAGVHFIRTLNTHYATEYLYINVMNTHEMTAKKKKISI